MVVFGKDVCFVLQKISMNGNYKSVLNINQSTAVCHVYNI